MGYIYIRHSSYICLAFEPELKYSDGSLCIHNIIDCVLMYELLMHDIIHSVLMYYLMSSCILQCSSTHSVQCMHLHWLTFEAGWRFDQHAD